MDFVAFFSVFYIKIQNRKSTGKYEPQSFYKMIKVIPLKIIQKYTYIYIYIYINDDHFSQQ